MIGGARGAETLDRKGEAVFSKVLAGAVVIAALVAGAPLAAAENRPDCYDPTVPLTVEENRLSRPVPQEILRRSGFERYATMFSSALCALPGAPSATTLAKATGKTLWAAAVARAQSPVPTDDMSVTDDRPLYWARLRFTSLLRQWTPADALTPEERAALILTFDRASRGQDTLRLPAGDGVRRIVVSGFDPFILDADIRRSNPSGAAALALDGTIVHTPNGPARIETAIFPVLWRPFEQGTVEDTFLPHLREGRARADMFVTVSQGRPGRFDVEGYNGRWRGGFPDNDNVSYTGVVPIPSHVPTVIPAPEFVRSTLPAAEMVAAPSGRFPVHVNPSVTEIPAGSSTPVFQPLGPTPGSVARAGSGGNYLSNEIAYRTTLLRDALGVSMPGGHLHTPVLVFGAGNTTEISDPVFEQNRLDIIAQTRALLVAAVGTLG